MVRQRRAGGAWSYEFMAAGKRYFGICEGCTTKREAEAYEKRMRERQASFAEQKSVDRLMERRRQEITGRKGIPLADAFDLSLLKPHRRTTSDKTSLAKRGCWADFVAFMEEKYPEADDLAAVSPSMAEEYIGIIRASGRFRKAVVYQRGKQTICRNVSGAPSARTATLYQTTCAEVFRLLARDAGIVENPFSMAKPPKQEETREAFTEAELRLIYKNLDDFTRPLFTVATLTALREGDICTLRWADVDFNDRLIRRTMNKTGRRVEIPIADELLAYLTEQHAHSGTGEYVFPEHATMYLKNQTGVSYRIKQFLEGLGIKTTRIPRGRSQAVSVKDLHSCRHTFCYYAGLKGIPLAVVQSIVGHMTPEMTKHYFAHATLADKRRGIAAMSSLLPGMTADAPALPNVEQERVELRRLVDTMPIEEVKRILATLKPSINSSAGDSLETSL